MLDPSHDWNISVKPLIWGFIVSAILVFAAYFIVVEQVLTGWALITAVVVLGGIQAITQLLLFMHIGVESKPRWNVMILLFMVLVIFIIIGGSMWIMRNLDYNLMPTTTTEYKRYDK